MHTSSSAFSVSTLLPLASAAKQASGREEASGAASGATSVVGSGAAAVVGSGAAAGTALAAAMAEGTKSAGAQGIV